MSSPKLIWDIGTGYDFFLSLEVIHNPTHYGLRPAWSAGMRARLPAVHRETLEAAQLLFEAPSPWVFGLPKPKDAATVLWQLSQIPPADRLLTLVRSHCKPPENLLELLQKVIKTGRWTPGDERLLCTAPRQFCSCMPAYTPKEARIALDSYAHTEEFGRRLLEALRAYHEVFFVEEEKRILPALERMLVQAQTMAKTLSFADLLESLTQGISIPHLVESSIELVLVPSFWSSPLIQYITMGEMRQMLVFGARPKNMSLIPGEIVPDMLIRSLKTLSDPTRLRILQHLTIRPMTPTQLARHLRLRPPTITHHLKALRLAGLIRITKDKNFQANSYAARPDALTNFYDILNAFLRGEDVAQDPETCCHHH